jgi:hypothetical protein
MKLTNLQRIILAAYAIAIINICIFYVPEAYIGPYNPNYDNQVVVFKGYAKIWEQPLYYGPPAWNEFDSNSFIRIDYYRMFVEVFTATIVTVVLLVITTPSKNNKKDDKQYGQQT